MTGVKLSPLLSSYWNPAHDYRLRAFVILYCWIHARRCNLIFFTLNMDGESLWSDQMSVPAGPRETLPLHSTKKNPSSWTIRTIWSKAIAQCRSAQSVLLILWLGEDRYRARDHVTSKRMLSGLSHQLRFKKEKRGYKLASIRLIKSTFEEVNPTQ